MSLDRRSIARLLPAALFMMAAQQSLGKTMDLTPVKVSIKVTTFEGKRALASITILNVSHHAVWILKDAPSLMLECDGAEVEDIGPMIKRREYTMADYDKVEPGELVNRQVEISNQFDYRRGTHSYTISTGGGYRDPVSRRFIAGPKATASFTLAR